MQGPRSAGGKGPSAEELEKLLSLRKMIATEIMTTEETYVASLVGIYDYFIVPLREDELRASNEKRAPILVLQEQLAIFSNWEYLMKGHVKFLATLKERVSTWHDNQLIGAIFTMTNYASIFKNYSYYVNNFDKAQNNLATYMATKPAFANFVSEQQAKMLPILGQQALGSLLIQPVQRIPRYVLLLGELEKNTVPTHPDYSSIVDATLELKKTADFINESKKQSEGVERVQNLCSKIKDYPSSLLFPELRILRHGILYEALDGGFYKSFVCLFNSSIAICEIHDEKKGTFKFIGSISLSACFIVTNKELSSIHIHLLKSPRHYWLHNEDAEWAYIYGINLLISDKKELKLWFVAINKAMEIDFEKSKMRADALEASVTQSERSKILNEYLADEGDYLNQLKTLKKLCLLVEESSDQNIAKTFSKITSSTKHICDFHESMHERLNSSIRQNSENMGVGILFKDAYKRFLLYDVIGASLLGVQSACESADKKSSIVQFLESFEEKNSFQVINFFAIMSRRVLYILGMLLELSRNTKKNHPDFVYLSQACNQLGYLSEKIVTHDPERYSSILGKKMKRVQRQYTSKIKNKEELEK